jgi:hypothetical protein
MTNAAAARPTEPPRRRRRALLFLLLLLALVLGGVLFFYLSTRALKSSAPYRMAWDQVRKDSRVAGALGGPLQEGWWVGGKVSEAEGRARLEFTVSGPEGTGKVVTRAKREGGVWKPEGVEVEVGDEAPLVLEPEPEGKAPEDPQTPGSEVALNPTAAVDFGETFDDRMVRFDKGRPSKVIEAVEEVVGKGRVRASTRKPPGGPTWTCVVVDGPEHYYELDGGWGIGDFAALQDAGFLPMPATQVRTRSDIYRVAARKGMGYQAERGDRVVILVCPKPEWKDLTFPWPVSQRRD